MLKGLVPIRDIFLFHKIYILFDVIFIHEKTCKDQFQGQLMI